MNYFKKFLHSVSAVRLQSNITAFIFTGSVLSLIKTFYMLMLYNYMSSNFTTCVLVYVYDVLSLHQRFGHMTDSESKAQTCCLSGCTSLLPHLAKWRQAIVFGWLRSLVNAPVVCPDDGEHGHIKPETFLSWSVI